MENCAGTNNELVCTWGLMNSYAMWYDKTINHWNSRVLNALAIRMPKVIQGIHLQDFGIVQCELKKGNGDSILNLSKSKRKIMKLLPVDDSIFLFLSYGTLVVHIGSGMPAQQSFSSCQNCLRPSCGCINCCFVVKAPAKAITQRKQRQLEEKQFWHTLQNWLLWQGSVAEYEWTMYEMDVYFVGFVISFFNFEKFGVKPWFPFLKLTQYSRRPRS